MVRKGRISDIESAANAAKYDRYRLLWIARENTPGKGVSSCLLHVKSLQEHVTVKFSDARREARVFNVQTCKSVWICPVCADRITRYRAAELIKGMETWIGAGNRVMMVTYTLSHHAQESCKAVLSRLQAAYKRFKGDRVYKSARKNWGIEGGVRVLECTYGANGWHWHMHEIFFLVGKDAARFVPIAHEFKRHWVNVVSQIGGAANEKGLDVKQETDKAFDYISKFGRGPRVSETGWNMALEVVRSPAKIREAAEGLHPFQILAALGTRENSADNRAWREFADATYNVRQLVYSPKLKTKLGLETVDDAAIVDGVESAEVLTILARITVPGWYRLNQRRALFVEFKQVADTGDAALLSEWLDSNNISMVSDGA